MNKCVKICVPVSRAIPFAFIILVIGWSYYAYVVAMCIYSIPSTNIGEKVAFIIFYHIFLGMFIWAYMKTVFTKPTPVPPEFSLTEADMANAEAVPAGNIEAEGRRREFLLGLVQQRSLPVRTRGRVGAGGTGEGSVRVCDTCRLIKPDRAHHCSTCGVCLLKMDHHCPWVNNCVGLHNYKYFLLFLFYGALYCCYVGSTSANYFVSFWTAGLKDIQAHRFHVLFVFFAAWMFSLSLLFLAGYHVFLTLRNRTTIESSMAPILAGVGLPDKRAFDLGVARNFRQIFGQRCLLWPLPVPSWQIDGVNWEQRLTPAAADQSCVSVSPIMLLPSHNRDAGNLDLEAAGV